MRRQALLAFALLGLFGCRAGGCAANVLGDVVGFSGDAYCDRRYVDEAREPGSFCQEIIDTVAMDEFQEDCREKHTARAGEGRCPAERRIGGCKVTTTNDDGSEVWDWYYDVADLEADAGLVFPNRAKNEADVRALCADPKRYDEGATFVPAP